VSIRLKLALILTLGIAGAAAAAGAVFLHLERESLRQAEEEKVRLVLDSVRRMAEEAALGKDPLMLLDYLAFLKKDRPEIQHCRVELGGRWQDVGAVPAEPAGGMVARAVPIPGGSAEVRFSSEVLSRREAAALAATVRLVARATALVFAAGLLVSAGLAWTLTRRIVLIEGALTAIGEGRLGETAPAAGSDEIGRLARGVNAMSARLKELDELKKTFVASVTHELRSPLGAIQSRVSEMASDAAFGPEQRRGLEAIRASASRLEHFVTNLLEAAKIERGKLEFTPKPCRLGPLVEDAALFFAARAKESGIALEAKVAPGLPELRLDPDLLTQVLSNLISNALKFTPAGGAVTVSARTRDDGKALLCSVADSGVGIPADAMARLFTPFERIRNPLKATGTGLGLAISKSIVELHGGSLRAESEPGKGSTFSFSLPLPT